MNQTPCLPGLFSDEPPPIRMAPAAIESRRDGHRVGRAKGETLRERYVELLKAHHGGLTDHEAGDLLGVLSTTAGARRGELMDADPGCIVAAGRVRVGDASRVRWLWAR